MTRHACTRHCSGSDNDRRVVSRTYTYCRYCMPMYFIFFVRALASRGRRVRWRRARGWDGWVGLVTSHDSWFVVVRRVHGPRARARSRDASSTNDERRATNDARRWNAFARGTGRTDGRTGRTMTDRRSRRGSFHSFTSSRDDSIHAFILTPFATRARGVCVHPCIHANARVSRVVFFFSRRVRASIGRTRRRARREVVESTPRVFACTHSNE